MHMIISSLTKLVKTMGQNIGATLLLLLIVIVSIGGWITVKHLTTILEHFPTPQVEQERFGRVLAVDELVHTDLNSTMHGIGADRVIVAQFHNGRVDLTGLPFNFASVTYVATAPGIAFSEDNFSSVPLSVLNDMLVPMWGQGTTRCVHLQADEVKNPVYRARLANNGTKQIIGCPVKNLGGGPVGVLVGSWVASDQINVEDASSKLSEAAGRISGYLSTIKTPKT